MNPTLVSEELSWQGIDAANISSEINANLRLACAAALDQYKTSIKL